MLYRHPVNLNSSGQAREARPGTGGQARHRRTGTLQKAQVGTVPRWVLSFKIPVPG